MFLLGIGREEGGAWVIVKTGLHVFEDYENSEKVPVYTLNLQNGPMIQIEASSLHFFKE